MKAHWTERSIKDFVFRLAHDFIGQLEKKMESNSVSPGELARKLRVSESRVSQILNNPGNFKIEKIVEYARALGMKVSIVAYEDEDPENLRGPINSEIFKISWEKQGKPKDFWAFQEETESMMSNFGSMSNKGYVPVELYNQVITQLMEATTGSRKFINLMDNIFIEKFDKVITTPSKAGICGDPTIMHFYDEAAENIKTVRVS